MENLSFNYSHLFIFFFGKSSLFLMFHFFITEKLIYKFYLFIMSEGKKGKNLKYGKKKLFALTIVYLQLTHGNSLIMNWKFL